MFCEECGSPLPDDANFCSECGLRLENGPQPGQAQTSMPGNVQGSQVRVGDIATVSDSSITATGDGSSVEVGDVAMMKNTDISAGSAGAGVQPGSSNAGMGEDGMPGLPSVEGGGVNLGDVGMIKNSTIKAETNITYHIGGSEKEKKFAKAYADALRRYDGDLTDAGGTVIDLGAELGLSDYECDKVKREVELEFDKALKRERSRAKYRLRLRESIVGDRLLSLDELIEALNTENCRETVPMVDVDRKQNWGSAWLLNEVVEHDDLKPTCARSGRDIEAGQAVVCRGCGMIIHTEEIDARSGLCRVCQTEEVGRQAAAAANDGILADAAVVAKVIESHGEKWARVPAGEFLMGSPESEQGRSDNEGLHEVEITRGLHVFKSLVNEQLFTGIMESDMKYARKSRPITNITWFDAIRFCNRYSETLGFKVPCYEITETDSGTVVTWNPESRAVRLLTEAEWEYACRAGSRGPYFIGQDGAEVDEDSLYDSAWYDEDEMQTLADLEPNKFGLHDMLGLVKEWVWDEEHDYSTVERSDPRTPSEGDIKVTRGGSIAEDYPDCRCASRFFISGTRKSHTTGFRIAMTADIPG